MSAIDWMDQKALIMEVREDRRKNKTCLSAQCDISVTTVLAQIVDSGYYRRDYESVTSALLAEKVDYDTAVHALKQIIAFGLFDV